MTSFWGIFAHPPHDVQTFRRYLLVRAFRRHRVTVEGRRWVEWAAGLAAETRAM